MKVQEYLDRIEYMGSSETNYATLCALQRAHLLTVPFENLDISLGKKIKLDEQSLWEKIILKKRGGFCYELNGLLAWLLKKIGFAVTHLNARDYHEEDDSFGMDFDHLVLMVHIPGEAARWLVDVGYGDNFTQPMNIDDPNEQVEGRRGYWLQSFRDGYQLWQRDYAGKRLRQYHFDLTAHSFPSEYEATCLYHQTSPASIFTQKRVISRLTEQGRITLSNNVLIITEHGEQIERITNEAERPHLLEKYFGVRLIG